MPALSALRTGLHNGAVPALAYKPRPPSPLQVLIPEARHHDTALLMKQLFAEPGEGPDAGE